MKKWWWLLLIAGLGLLICAPFFGTGFPYTHDGENHLARFANYKLAVKEGQVPPRWAPNLLNRYGYPVFNYNYPLANIASLPFSALKLNYEVTFGLLATGLVMLGLLGIKQWTQLLTSSSAGQALAVSAYGLSPAIFTLTFYRGNIGEIAAWGILPWLLWSVDWLRKKHRPWWHVGLLSTGWAAFFLAHNVMAVFGTALVIGYAVTRFWLKNRLFRQFATVLALAVILSLWFWLPALAEKQLIILDGVDVSTAFTAHFPTINQLLWSPVQFGFSMPGSIDSLSFSLGLAQVLAVILASWYSLKLGFTRNWSRAALLGSVSLGALTSILFQFQVTAVIWHSIPFARFIQFPWRLSLLFGVMAAGAIALVLNQNQRWKYVLASLLVFQALGMARLEPVDRFHKLNRDYDAFAQTTSTNNENLPADFTYQDIADWAPTAKILTGAGNVTIDYWKGSDRQYQLTLTEPSLIVEPTAAFAGWQTRINDVSQNQSFIVEYTDPPETQGRVAYQLDPGTYQVRTRFTQWTWPRIVGNTVSTSTALCLLVYMSFQVLKNRPV